MDPGARRRKGISRAIAFINAISADRPRPDADARRTGTAESRGPLDDRRHAHAEADAQGREASVHVLAFHLVEHGGDEPAASQPERMAQADRPAVHVQLRVVESDRVARRDWDGGEGLVDLPEVDVVRLEVDPCERLANRGDRAVEHDRRVRAGDARGNKPRAGLELQLLRCLRIRDQDRAGAVVDAARVARSNSSIRFEGGREGRELLERRVPPWVLVRVEHPLVAALVEDRHRDDLPLEPALVDRADRLVVGPQRELVHLRPRHVVLVRHEVGRDALLHDLVFLEELRAQGAGVRSERHAGHRLDAARDDDVGLARHHFHRGEVERLQAGGAHPVHARARDRLRESGDERCEPSDVHPLLVDLRDASEDDVLDDLRLDAGAVGEGPQRERGEVVGPPLFQGAAAPADRRPHGFDDHGLGHGLPQSTSWDASDKKVRERARRLIPRPRVPRPMPAALDGIVVLDFTRLLPGPFCTQLLCNLGADVNKIEDPQLGDYMRAVPPTIDDTSYPFLMVNRGKRSLAVDLKTPEGQEVLRRLARRADVVVEQFRPGVMTRLGVDYDGLAMMNPRLVYCSFSGYGQTGPYKDLPGHDINFEALAAILAALRTRDATGRGEFIDVAIYDTAVVLMVLGLARYLATGEEPVAGETLLTGVFPFYNLYETKDGRWLAVATVEPKFWTRMCELVGAPDLADRQFAEGEARATVAQTLAARFRERTLESWEALFAGEQLPITAVKRVTEVVQDPQVNARGLLPIVDIPGLRKVQVIAHPAKHTATTTRNPARVPKKGQDTDSILRSIGYTTRQIADLTKRGVIAK